MLLYNYHATVTESDINLMVYSDGESTINAFIHITVGALLLNRAYRGEGGWKCAICRAFAFPLQLVIEPWYESPV